EVLIMKSKEEMIKFLNSIGNKSERTKISSISTRFWYTEETTGTIEEILNWLNSEDNNSKTIKFNISKIEIERLSKI
ncbi:MAG: hypothetical protein WC934_11680, partial [Acidithiobacillus sp.]|uniref:hypothetical protein n=1 Tax=Acidithiobacillus sp. TaxID=1872118 RepID=UPI00355E7C79